MDKLKVWAARFLHRRLMVALRTECGSYPGNEHAVGRGMRGRIGHMAGFAGIIGSLAITVPVLAANFDCAHTASPREQLICRDPMLSDLDDQLGRAYQAHRASLTPHGADLLQNSERNWSHFVTTVCPLVVPADADLSRDPKNCLEKNYRERLDELAKVGQSVGPFVFNRIDLYGAEPTPDVQSGATPGFYVQHVAYPQIDSPHTPEADAWNRQSMKILSENGTCDSSLGDYDTDYEIGYANQRVISVQWVNSFYCHGTPHGFGGYEAQNVVLGPTLRALTYQDVFGMGDDWVEKLQHLFWNALGESGWRPPVNHAENVKGDIEQKVIRPEYWMFTPKGLKVSFNAYEGGCYACTPQPVTVPWSDLKPLLSRDALLP